MAGLALERGTPVLFEVAEGEAGRGLWIETAGLALHLVRTGYEVRAPIRWRHLYSPDYVERPGEQVQRVLLTRGAAPPDADGIDLGDFGAWKTGGVQAD